jgi:predicted transcriptional regulator
MKYGSQMTNLALERIETGEASPKEARATISDILKEGSSKSYQKLYGALGSWLWKAIDSRRRDDELREWFDIFRRTSAAIADTEPAYAERLHAFYDLLQTSITTSKMMSVEDVLKREHVRNVIRLLGAAEGRPTEKSVIARHVGLKPSNLTRVLNMMTDARLVERTSYGRHAQFCLTREGLSIASKIASKVEPIRKAEKEIARRLGPFQLEQIEKTFQTALAHRLADYGDDPHIRQMPSLHNTFEIVDLLLSGVKPTVSTTEHSALQQVNVTMVPRTRSYESLITGGLVKLIPEKKAETSRSLLPRIMVETTQVEGAKGFKAMISYLSKEDRDHVER